MRKITMVMAVLVLLWGVLTLAPDMRAANARNAADFDKLVDRYFDFYFQFHPKDATAAGFHQYDSKLEDLSRTSREAEIADLHTFAAEFDWIDPRKLPEQSAGDVAFLESTIKARLLELQIIQMWRKDASLYPGDATESIFVIIKRNFAPRNERLQSVIARERLIPRLLMNGRDNLVNPPEIYTRIALEQMPDIIEFFQKDVPEAFQEPANGAPSGSNTVPAGIDAPLWAEFQQANAAVMKSLQGYQSFLQDDLLPRSQGDFRLGAEKFRQKLIDDEMVNMPLDDLLKIGYADLHRNQQRLKETAALIDPHAGPRQVLASLEKDHPAPDALLQAFSSLLTGLRDYIEAHHLVTIPSPILPILEETPPFMRATTTASMDTPGAYETKATEAMFNVTLPQHDWSRQRVQEWMEGFNRGTITSTAIHEAYPGHYVQFLWAKRLNSKVRKLLYCNTNVEGWAHYCEQMMLDEGYGGGDPKLRMGQLQDALLRDARFIVGIEMHTGEMSMDQARNFFVEEGYQVPAVAGMEVKRGTIDPTYLYYTLGKLQILKLRHDYQAKLGNSFNLQEFHDRFLQQGGVPLVIIRRAMLGDNGPTL